MKYWIERDGRWISIFITPDQPRRNEYGELIGQIYNLRRVRSHKKVRLCWENLERYRANASTVYTMRPSELIRYKGPYEVWW